MKRLLFLRHAKAEPSRGEPDHARRLAPRGRADAETVGRTITAGGWAVDTALVSDATRTRETFEGAEPFLRPAPVLNLEPRLYEASSGQIMDLVAATSDQTTCLLVIGHNPGIALAAMRAAGQGRPSDMARLAGAFPTSALAVLRFDVEHWPDLRGAPGELEALVWVDRSGQAD